MLRVGFGLLISFLVFPSARIPHAGVDLSYTGCGTLQSSFGDDRCVRISFSGEVLADHGFQQKFGELRFRLKPSTAGWHIEVNPDDDTTPGHLDYSWVVTPPYRAYNDLYVDTTYGVKADLAVKLSPRNFNFALNGGQYDRAQKLVELAIMSHPLEDHRSAAEFERESVEAIAALELLPIGKGRFTIVDSRVDQSGGAQDEGTIEWLKFQVELHVPCSFAVADSREMSIDRKKCSDDQKRF
jgi:hypothetical protein